LLNTQILQLSQSTALIIRKLKLFKKEIEIAVFLFARTSTPGNWCFTSCYKLIWKPNVSF